MSFPDILHYGFKDGVTSSCQQLLMGVRHSLLIDCGLFQGVESSVQCNAGADWLAVVFPPDLINALAATHEHFDHVGRIPYPQSGEKKRVVFSSHLGAPQELLSSASKPPTAPTSWWPITLTATACTESAALAAAAAVEL